MDYPGPECLSTGFFVMEAKCDNIMLNKDILYALTEMYGCARARKLVYLFPYIPLAYPIHSTGKTSSMGP
jgi:hypothetical protein